MHVPLHTLRLLFVTGKGGVGKTAVTAVLAHRLAQRGRRVLAIEIGGVGSLARRLGLSVVGYEPRRAAPGIDVCRITPEECLREYGLMKLRFRRAYKLVFENPFVRSLVNVVPGMEELLLLGKLGFLVQSLERGDAEAPWDVVLVDAPPTGQGANLFALPGIILSAVTAGPMARETAYLQALLRDHRRTGVLLVTNPEELAVDEALELERELTGRAGMPLRAILVNRVLPGGGEQEGGVLGTWLQARRATRQLEWPYPLVASALRILRLRESQEVEMERLRRRAAVAIFDLPFVPSDSAGMEQRDLLERALEPLLEQDDR